MEHVRVWSGRTPNAEGDTGVPASTRFSHHRGARPLAGCASTCRHIRRPAAGSADRNRPAKDQRARFVRTARRRQSARRLLPFRGVTIGLTAAIERSVGTHTGANSNYQGSHSAASRACTAAGTHDCTRRRFLRSSVPRAAHVGGRTRSNKTCRGHARRLMVEARIRTLCRTRHTASVLEASRAQRVDTATSNSRKSRRPRTNVLCGTGRRTSGTGFRLGQRRDSTRSSRTFDRLKVWRRMVLRSVRTSLRSACTPNSIAWKGGGRGQR